ncbi:MAG: hypothetical protein N3D85_04705 [Candidatus Bathyarchaeota archaeon]|nr:hypothetical protein [Candidatus Bathyarchaeota archaeon]
MNSRCNIVSGEIALVNLVDDWEALEEYAGEKQGFYQLLGVDGTIEIQDGIVCVGKRAGALYLRRCICFCSYLLLFFPRRLPLIFR